MSEPEGRANHEHCVAFAAKRRTLIGARRADRCGGCWLACVDGAPMSASAAPGVPGRAARLGAAACTRSGSDRHLRQSTSTRAGRGGPVDDEPAGVAARRAVLTRGRVRRPARRLGDPVDPPRAGPAGRRRAARASTSPWSGRWPRTTASGGWWRREPRSPRRRSAIRSMSMRPAWRPRRELLLPVPGRRRGEPDRPHRDGAGRPTTSRTGCASPSPRARTTRTGYTRPIARSPLRIVDLVVFLGDYIYEGGPQPDRLPAARHRGAGRHRRLSQPVCRVQGGSRPPGGPRRGAVGVHVRRSRGGQQLVGCRPRRRHAPRPVARGLRRATSRGLPGLLRASAAAAAAPSAGAAEFRIHRSIDWGRLARFHVLDTRQYRDDQPCDLDGDAGMVCAEVDDPARTMLGPGPGGLARPATSGPPRRSGTCWPSRSW